MKTILLVRRVPGSDSPMVDLLKRRGYVVEQVEAGPEALRRARELRPDAVLVDIPAASPGFEVAQTMGRAGTAPCVLVTCEARQHVRDVMERAQAISAVVFAPCGDAEILSALDARAVGSRT